MSPGLFLGWRIDPGFRYRNVLRVLDYQEYRTRGGNSAVDVPEAEIFVPEGDPVFSSRVFTPPSSHQGG